MAIETSLPNRQRTVKSNVAVPVTDGGCTVAIITGMVTEPYKGVPARIYVAEHLADHERRTGETIPALAARMGTTRETVWRWADEPHRLNPNKIQGLADALGIDPTRFWHPPGTPSLDTEMQGATAEQFGMAADIVKRVMKGKKARE